MGNMVALFRENDAVSPVIGVILMVAVTVILAAVIGTFVLGIGSQVAGDTPKVSLGFVFDSGGDGSFTGANNDDTVTITHRGGDDVKNKRIRVNIAGTNAGPCTTKSWPTEIGAGDKTTIEEDSTSTCSGLLSTGDSVKVIWEKEDDEDASTAIIGEDTVP